MDYWIIEIFTSIQGEGEIIGTPSNFIRLARCNLRCLWCDTTYSWEKGIKMGVDEIVSHIRNEIRMTTITGGEPLLQNLIPLASRLKAEGQRIAVETNGTIKPSDELRKTVDVFSVSPKLRNSGHRINYGEMDWATYFKFVILNKEDLKEVKDFVEEHGIDPGKVIVQPDGRREDYIESLRQLSSDVMDLGLPFRVLPQLHRIISVR
ncbi:7-carboxy-7-deazaguanine synthase QueE [Sulfuracidifex tepidarius]|uniref:7-carboxy-7-deazaguanine synthase n=1 Tax=Sulfuracidifex tepidarius TaxID=1294262 RepID=A0A510E2S6_9CREN|nr:7-carboxy-7-deazaguanine synthase QueE [Sulfuracidifex tepidarius]BBG24044.1 7-carboxy-7-deazaguanine synthase [Sulfuracidifex tepidarius]BBG26799.1 7-carboxy-7-deazaguanine synthase [Sulfuracidifex tepidarius]